MTIGEKIGNGIAIGLATLFILTLTFWAGRMAESHRCVHFLDDGRKFVSTCDGMDCYLINREIWVEKLPNGFYRMR